MTNKEKTGFFRAMAEKGGVLVPPPNGHTVKPGPPPVGVAIAPEEAADYDPPPEPSPRFDPSATGAAAKAPKSLAPLDLSAWLDNPKLEPEKPTVGNIVGGGALFYRGRLNEVHGEPGIGKSNVNLVAAVDVLERGGRVAYIDPEDTPRAIVLRLLAFGADKEAIRERFHYWQNPEPGDFPGIIAFAEDTRPDLVVLDGLAEIITAHGLSEDKAPDVLAVLRDVARPFTGCGAAVVLSDHVVKNGENRGQWARGSGAKLGRYDGAVYEVRLGKAYGPDREGFLTLTVSKDRNGGVGPMKSKVAEIHFTPDPEMGGTRVGIVRPKPSVGEDGKFRPTCLMEKVSRALEDNPELSTRGLRETVGGKHDYIDKAIEALMEDGFLEEQPPATRGKPTRFRLLKPYREECAPSVPQVCPECGGAHPVGECAPVPPPYTRGGMGRTPTPEAHGDTVPQKSGAHFRPETTP